MIDNDNKSTLPVMKAALMNLGEMLNPEPGRRQNMQGFDAEFVDIVHYIIVITFRIWDLKQVDRCLDYYGEDAAIHTLAGDVIGASTVVENTWKTLAAFPDRTLDGDNVIWSGDEDKGYYTSHLITSHMTNHGPSEYGPATGKHARIYTIADCLNKENRIIEEWLVRDNLSLVNQLGLDANAIAKDQAKSDKQGGDNLRALHQIEIDRVRATKLNSGQMKPNRPEQDAEGLARYVFETVWNSQKVDSLSELYDYRADVVWPNDRRFYGPVKYAAALEIFFAEFTDVKVVVDHVADIPYLEGGRDIAVRWQFVGRHVGNDLYGPATSAAITILGCTQWRVIKGFIHCEWTIFDELAVMRQIERARLD